MIVGEWSPIMLPPLLGNPSATRCARVREAGRAGSGLQTHGATVGTIEAGLTMTDRIEINAGVMQGKPVIRGTRIPVELLLRKLAGGAKSEDLLDAYPRLVADDIRAALAYAADTIAHETVLELSSR